MPNGPFRYAVLDSTGAVRDAFRSQSSAEHAARMLAFGAGYDPHAALGARVFPLCAPTKGEYTPEAHSANLALDARGMSRDSDRGTTGLLKGAVTVHVRFVDDTERRVI